MNNNNNPASTKQMNVIKDNETEKLVLDRLNNLSMEERTEGIHELHGVANSNTYDSSPPMVLEENGGGGEGTTTAPDGKENDPQTVQRKLNEMAEISTRMIAATNNSQHQQEAYLTATEMDPTYVEQIKLLCLKADSYDATKAAARVLAFFEFKLDVFGRDKLAKDITLDDLDTKAYQILVNDGRVQLLQQRDRAGRGITIMYGANGAHLIDLKTWVSAVWSSRFCLSELELVF